MTCTAPASGVAFVQGQGANWVIVDGDAGPVLIDTGYPQSLPAVLASLRQRNWGVEDLAAILLTHGHSDHLGNAGVLAGIANCPVYAHVDEIPNVRRDILEQTTIPQLFPHLFRPGVARWALHAIRAGGRTADGVPNVLPLPATAAGAASVLGINIVPIPTPGHTRGHVSFYLPTHAILITGDALITAHPTTSRRGPQLLPTMFHGSSRSAAAALVALAECPAMMILPGHGPSMRISPADAVAHALTHGTPY